MKKDDKSCAVINLQTISSVWLRCIDVWRMRSFQMKRCPLVVIWCTAVFNQPFDRWVEILTVHILLFSPHLAGEWIVENF